MGDWRRRLFSTVVAVGLLLGTATIAQAAGDEHAVLIPGATVLKPINPVMPLFQRFYYPFIGTKFHDDDDPEVIDYPQEALAADWAIRLGVERTIGAIAETDGKVVVIGESMGSMVAARVAVQMAAEAHPVSTDDIRFVLIVPPEVGAAEYFKVGTFIPILNYRVARLPESPYPTTIVIGEYDFWSDAPDRPWNLISLLNSALAIAFVHSFEALIDPADVPLENITVEQNSLGVPVTTYFVPAEHLPLTQILRVVVPGVIVDALDQLLRPIVDAAYVRHDEPGDTRPYLSEGEIRRNVPIETSETDETDELDPEALSDVTPAAAPVRRAPAGAEDDNHDPAADSAASPQPPSAGTEHDEGEDAVDPPDDAPQPEPEPESEPEPEHPETGADQGQVSDSVGSVASDGAAADGTAA